MSLRYQGKQGVVLRLKGELFIQSLLMMSPSVVTHHHHLFSPLFILCSHWGCIFCSLLCCRGSAGTHCAQNGTETGNLGLGMASNRFPRCQRSGKEFGCPWELNGGYHAKMRQRPESGIRSSWISYQVVGKRFGSPHRTSKTGTRHLWWLIEPKTGQ